MKRHKRRWGKKKTKFILFTCLFEKLFSNTCGIPAKGEEERLGPSTVLWELQPWDFAVYETDWDKLWLWYEVGQEARLGVSGRKFAEETTEQKMIP